jgi:hypothetical protein
LVFVGAATAEVVASAEAALVEVLTVAAKVVEGQPN